MSRYGTIVAAASESEVAVFRFDTTSMEWVLHGQFSNITLYSSVSIDLTLDDSEAGHYSGSYPRRQ
jgi:hypothetical protein